ncbi:MAG: hypothetical protein RIR11_3155 [Bacteroidota bacterium]|jgi:CRP/FNR family cyclic AMP-dependent transcriptional regulator
MSQALWHLENIDVTHLLCPTKMGSDEIMSHYSHLKVKKGANIYVPAEMANHIYFINEGRVKIAANNEDGKEVTKAILGRGEVFGELVLMGETTRHDTAQALEDTNLCVVSLEELRQLMRDRNELNLFFMRIFGKKQLEMERRLESLVFKDSRSRIVEFLVQTTRNKGERVGYEWVVRQFYTHQEIANMTATSRQTVTTTLNDLRYKKLITFNRSRLLIRDLDGLEKSITAKV